MKLTFTLILIFLSLKLSAQVNGVVTDNYTHLPISNATVRAGYLVTTTSTTGKFTLPNTRFGDTLKISCIGYKPYSRLLGIAGKDTIPVYLEQSYIGLKGVTIKAAPDYKIDSIKNRRAYAGTFNYKPMGVKDIFITRSPYTNVPYGYNTTQNNTTAIISVNVLQLVSLLNKNKAPQSKLQKILIQDEQESYVDQVFSKQKVTTITKLKGDSLSAFMSQYRPTLSQAKSMSEYDITLYIKNSYNEFMKGVSKTNK